MNFNRLSFAAIFSGFLILSCFQTSHAGPVIGKPAPAFSIKDSDGKTHTLTQYKGKIVVLEWLNHGCPYVKKHYETKNMQKLQQEVTSGGGIWLSVVSSAPGKQGFVTDKDAKAEAKEHGSKATAVLLDPDGAMGKNYGAKTTPHMFIVDVQGNLGYMGAIDSIRSTDTADVPKAKNYVTQAWNELKAGKPVSESSTEPYGCSIKYKD